MSPHLSALFDWRTWAVFRRNARVYLRNWRTAFVPPALEPVIFFLAMGLGIGGYIGAMPYADTTVGYATYVAPGMIAYTTFSTPFFEGLYASYVRMVYQKTFDGILATQVELEHVVWGEVVWCGARGTMNGSVVALVLLLFDLFGAIDIALPWLLAVPVLGFVAGWTFGAFALIFTAVVPSIDHMNYPVFLIGVPLGLVSNTFFPIETGIAALDALVRINPVYHLAESLRALLVLGRPSLNLLWLLLSAGAFLLLFVSLAQRLMRKRVLGD